MKERIGERFFNLSIYVTDISRELKELMSTELGYDTLFKLKDVTAMYHRIVKSIKERIKQLKNRTIPVVTAEPIRF